MILSRVIVIAQAALIAAWASSSFAADLEPHMKTKLCGGDEASCTDVSVMSGVKRARVDATLTGAGGTIIGNVGDRLKVDSLVTVVPAASTFATILRQSEITVATKAETDLPGGSYTVPADKTLAVASFAANYDTQSPLVVRLKKQTGGAGAFATLLRLTLKQHGQDNSNVQFTFPYAIVVGAAGDVFKITYESALARGSLWASFTGVEY